MDFKETWKIKCYKPAFLDGNNLQKVNMEQREIIYGMIPTLRVTGLQNFVIPRALVRQVTLTPHQHQVAFQN